MRILFLCFLAFLITACASGRSLPGSSGVIVDTKGVDMSAFEDDLEECELIAEQVPVGERAATGAAVGAVLGGVIGGVIGDSDTAQRGAGVGAVSGGARGAQDGLNEEDRVIKNCMQGRGYRVLN